MMKGLLLLLFAVGAAGFSPSTVARKQTPLQLQAATGVPGTPRLESTKPVAVRPVSKFERMRMKNVMLDPDYTLTWSVAALCPLILFYHPCK